MRFIKLIVILGFALFSLITFNQNNAQAFSGSDSMLVAQEKTVTKYVNTKSGIILRKTASPNGENIGSLSNGTEVSVHSTTNGWSYVTVGDKKGYVVDSFLTTKKPEKVPNASTPAKPIEFGTLKGTVTWQYNKVIGTKPDVGAQIFIIPTNFDYKKYKENDFKNYIFVGITETIKDVYYAEANGYGNYELTDIPVGKYLVIIVSKNTTRNPDDQIYLEETLKPLIGETNYANFKKFRLNFQKHTWETLEVKKDGTKDFSKDFGYTYF